MGSRFEAIVLASMAAACTETPRAETPRAYAPTSASARVPAIAPERPASADVQVDVRAPLRARYVPDAMGAERPSLGVDVTNRGGSALDVSSLRVRLEATREGLSFGCADEVGAPPSAREPSVLAPGASFTFERALDCALPLVGAYAVRVSVAFGRGAWASPREVRSFVLTISPLSGVEPRRVDGVPGLWASLGASATLRGAPAGAHGRIAVTLVSSSRTPIELPPMLLALRVRRVGSSVTCEDRPTPLAAPAVLGPGAIHRERLEVSCLGLGVPGRYDVAARLIVPRGKDPAEEHELGRLRVEITPPSFQPPGWP